MVSKAKKSIKLSQVIWLAILVVGLYVIVPQFKAFHSSLKLLTHPSLGWTIAAFILSLLTYFEAASTYLFLAFKRLSYIEEVVVQFAAMFVNRLLPAGIGGISANYEYLRHKGLKRATSASIVATNNLLGLSGHLLILLGALLLTPSGSALPRHLNIKLTLTTKLIGLGLIIILLLGAVFYRRQLVKLKVNLTKQLVEYKHHPAKLLLAQLSQMLLTLTNIVCLSYSAKAIGVHLSFTAILIIFSFASGVRNFTPTPGGLGGIEAGLVAGFVAYKVNSSGALAAVLLYRLVNYWVPLALGAMTFIYAGKKRLFSS